MKASTAHHRFKFGKNWRSFLSALNDGRILEAQKSLKSSLKLQSLSGKSFLDVGCGSGLFSLAAIQLGADYVYSFDYDPICVQCTLYLRELYFPNSKNWVVEQGSILDEAFISKLEEFDIVYAWGVLHHTGNMWEAMQNITKLVRENGKLYISIYNDQGFKSLLWKHVKKTYCCGPLGKAMVISIFLPYFLLGGLVVDLSKGLNPLKRYRLKYRGMSTVHDWFDWLGGYPFETASPDEVFHFYHIKGFDLSYLKTCGGKSGCNEFLFLSKNSGKKLRQDR